MTSGNGNGNGNGRIGWRLRDIVGIVVLGVWGVLHLADAAGQAIHCNFGMVDTALIAVVGWFGGESVTKMIVAAKGPPAPGGA